jgi:adenylate cyclase, class 2
MSGPIEREIKLRYDCAEDARAAVVAAGGAPIRGRRMQDDRLYDTADGSLVRERSTLRVRTDGADSVLTFKGPVQPGPVKTREELETEARDGRMLHLILTRLGFHVWFRYQKYREEFLRGDVLIAVDETPVGTFVEIEGTEDGIMAAAAAMGRTPADFILDSYYRLFEKHRDALGFRGSDMLFDDPDREP